MAPHKRTIANCQLSLLAVNNCYCWFSQQYSVSIVYNSIYRAFFIIAWK